jgi:hypothetical protein
MIPPSDSMLAPLSATCAEPGAGFTLFVAGN